MKTGRRTFIKGIGAASVMASVPVLTHGRNPSVSGGVPSVPGSSRMKLSYRTYNLQLRHTFTVSGFSRNTTPVVLTEIEFEGFTGYGEASMPPYLGESQESVIAFLKKVDLGQFKDPFLLDDILEYVACPITAYLFFVILDFQLVEQPFDNVALGNYPEQFTAFPVDYGQSAVAGFIEFADGVDQGLICIHGVNICGHLLLYRAIGFAGSQPHDKVFDAYDANHLIFHHHRRARDSIGPQYLSQFAHRHVRRGRDYILHHRITDLQLIHQLLNLGIPRAVGYCKYPGVL